MRYLHDAFKVYSSASIAMKAITEEVMVANCYGNVIGGLPNEPEYSFYGNRGYIHGIEQDDTTSVPGFCSGAEAVQAFTWMPNYDSNEAIDILYLRSASQFQEITATVAGDFPNHDCSVFFLDDDNTTHIPGLYFDRDNGRAPGLGAGGDPMFLVAAHVTEFSFQPLGYNCLAVKITVEGNVLDPLSETVFKLTLGKMITLRCAPAKQPW